MNKEQKILLQLGPLQSTMEVKLTQLNQRRGLS